MSSQYLYFCCAVAEKWGKGESVNLLDTIFGISNFREGKRFFCNTETKLYTLEVFYEKILISKFDILPEHGLTLGQT